MPKEYILPPSERLDNPSHLGIKKGDNVIRVYDKSEIKRSPPIDVANLEKSSLDYLGEWKLIMNKTGYGIAHRLGIKYNFLDDEGDPAVLFVHFYNPVAKKGLEINQAFIDEQEKSVKDMVNQFAMQVQENKGIDNVICLSSSPPAWMFNELEKMLQAGENNK